MKVVGIAIALLFPSLAIAAGAEGHQGQDVPSAEQWKLLAFTVANFGIFVFLMFRLSRAPLRDFLVNRRRQIADAMADAARLKEEAITLKREYEERLAGLDATRRGLLAEIRAIAEADRDRILATAEQAAERMRRDAERTAQSDLERARQELRAEAARLAMDLASEEIGRRIGDDDRRRLLGEFVARVQK